MSEEGIATESLNGNGAEASNVVTEHLFYEIGGEVLDKSNTLTSILEVHRFRSALIFCNSFSDTDMVEVILKKKNIPFFKLTNDQPRTKIQAAKLAHEKSGTIIITVDSAGQGMDLAPFDAVINYSIPSEPEVYLHRTGADGDAGKPGKAISLVGPLDFSNFHFIKKVSGVPFVKGNLPSNEELLKVRVDAMAKEASELQGSDKVKAMAALIIQHPERDALVHLLVNNLLNAKPAPAPAAAPRRDEGRRGRDRDDDFGGDRGDRDFRDRRGGRRDFRDRDDSDQGSGDSEQFGGDRGSEGGRDRWERRDEPPPAKDVRFYLGHGVKEGFSQAEFAEILNKHLNLAQDKIKRFSLRDCYSFVDLAEEDCMDLGLKLEAATVKSGKPLFVKKATAISAPRNRTEGQRDGGQSFEGDGQADEHNQEQSQSDENAGY